MATKECRCQGDMMISLTKIDFPIHDALQYLMLGGGEGRKVLNNQKQV